MATAMTNEALKALQNRYHTLAEQPTLGMTAEDEQAHMELIQELAQKVMKAQTENLSQANIMTEGKAEELKQITDNLAPAANDSAYSSLVESLSKGADIIDSLLFLAQ